MAPPSYCQWPWPCCLQPNRHTPPEPPPRRPPRSLSPPAIQPKSNQPIHRPIRPSNHQSPIAAPAIPRPVSTRFPVGPSETAPSPAHPPSIAPNPSTSHRSLDPPEKTTAPWTCSSPKSSADQITATQTQATPNQSRPKPNPREKPSCSHIIRTKFNHVTFNYSPLSPNFFLPPIFLPVSSSSPSAPLRAPSLLDPH